MNNVNVGIDEIQCAIRITTYMFDDFYLSFKQLMDHIILKQLTLLRY
jgi:hypothetical protein